jgi:2'-5' RNA ligase
MQAGSLILVHFLEEQAEGYRFERKRNQWPLHITLVPWFTVADEEVLKACLTSVMQTTEAFAVTVGEQVLFGGHQEIAVNLISDQTDVVRLHHSLMALLQGMMVRIYDTHWTGAAYRAHITRHDAPHQWRTEGSKENFYDVHLVRLLAGNVCEIAERFVLNGSRPL